MDDLQQPRYFREANTQFLLPGGYSMQGLPPGLVLVVVGMGLGYWWLIPVGIVVGMWLAKRMGEDENYLKSALLHLLTHKGMRYIVAAPREPAPRVMIISRGSTVSAADWVNSRRGARGAR